MDDVDILIGERDIARRVDRLALDIAEAWPRAEDGAPRPMTMVAVLKGAFVFAADLIRALHAKGLAVEVDFMRLKSYGDATERASEIAMRGGPERPLAGRHVLLVDDILDTGHSLDLARRHLLGNLEAASLRTCVLLDKPARRELPIAADHVGFTVPDRFVVGYGIDHAERYRDLPHIGAVTMP